MKYELLGFRKGEGDMKLEGAQCRMSTLENTGRGKEGRNDKSKQNKMKIKKEL